MACALSAALIFVTAFVSQVTALQFANILSSTAPSLELSSGLKLNFEAAPNSSYCLLSDPCIHVNALTGSPSFREPATWVQGIGVRTALHALVFNACVRKKGGKAVVCLALLDGNDITHELLSSRGVRSADGSMVLGVVEEGQAYLVTAMECGVRLLLRLHTLSSLSRRSVTMPHFVSDTLDWQNLEAPHGIVGQMFSHGANSGDPASASFGFQPGAKGLSLKRVHYAVKVAVTKLRGLMTRPTILDGSPGDYLSSGVIEADCLFSRFGHEDQASLQQPTGDDDVDEVAFSVKEIIRTRGRKAGPANSRANREPQSSTETINAGWFDQGDSSSSSSSSTDIQGINDGAQEMGKPGKKSPAGGQGSDESQDEVNQLVIASEVSADEVENVGLPSKRDEREAANKQGLAGSLVSSGTLPEKQLNQQDGELSRANPGMGDSAKETQGQQVPRLSSEDLELISNTHGTDELGLH